MGSHRLSAPLTLRPRPSWRLAILVAVTHGLALAVILPLPLGVHRIPLLLAVTGSALYVLLDVVLMRAPWSIRSATWGADGSWLLTLASGKQVEASLSPATFVSLPLVSLNFRLGFLRRRALPLCSDALDPDQLRRLRQRLRTEGGRNAGDLDPG